MKKWPFLWQLVESGHLLTIDYAFAEYAKSEEEAALLAALMAFHRLGHLCLKIEKEEIFPSLELLTPEPKEWEKRIRSVEGSPLAVREDNRFYLPKLWKYEQQFIQEIERLLKMPSRECGSHSFNEQLTPEQRHAVQNALCHPLSLVAGGPGTGKSFTAIQIAQAFLQEGKNAIFLAAPTGKAAANLEKRLPGIHSSTLHALLELRSSKDLQKSPPWIHVDLLIVDECSMVDGALFAHLMKAVQGNTHLVLMGDPFQLPAVEGGSFFADLITCKNIPSTFLTRPLRFGKSALIELSQAILEGKGDRVPFIPLPDDEEWLWEKVRAHFPKPCALPPENIEGLNRFRLLSALRRGPMGVETLNEWLVRRFQSLGKVGDYFAAPIMIGRNDVRTGLCNGEMGLLVHEIGSYEGDYALFEGGKCLPRAQLPRFEYAYAISVHKSQGSEYDEVLVLLPEGAEAFGRELLYTAATRAKERLEIAGDPARIALMLRQLSGKISGVREKLGI